MSATTPPAAYAGWHRPTRRARWARVCAAPTWRECYAALLDATRGRGGDTAVLSEGRHPGDARRVLPPGG